MSLKRSFFNILDAAPVGLKKIAFSGLSNAQSALYLLEAQPLRILDALIRRDFSSWNMNSSQREVLVREAQRLLKYDVSHFENGIYPLSLFRLDTPVRHIIRYGKVLTDAVRVSMRKTQMDHETFKEPAQEFLTGVPDYYQRNFHFQTDGYLSETSAELYDHQVDILFGGLADAMRRLLLAPLRSHFRETDGSQLKILDVACGTGSSSRLLAEMFPKAHITCLDLSSPYLAHARKRLAEYTRLNFMQADAAQMPFQDSQFDVVCSTFLFHELPENVRGDVIAEQLRVLKPEGFYGLVDSLQKDDTVDLNWGLEQFPRDFHEPFYCNYTLRPLMPLLEKAGLMPQTQTGFFAKAMWATKMVAPKKPRLRPKRAPSAK